MISPSRGHSRRFFNRSTIAVEAGRSTLSFTSVVSILAAFLTLSGGLWHLGYWSTFNFNYFEYSNYSDLFKTSFYPFFLSIWVFIGTIVFVFGLMFPMAAILQNRASLRNQTTNIGTDLTSREKLLISSAIGISFVVTGWFWIVARPIYMWDVLPFSISVGFFLLMVRFNLFVELVPNSNVRMLVWLLLVVIPTFNFFNGKKISIQILNGQKANIVTGFNCTNPILNRIIVGRPLLGTSSEYLFFYMGRFYRNQFGSPRDILVLKKDMVLNYTVTDCYFYDSIKLYRHDYFDSIQVNLQIDSIMKYNPSKKNIDSLKQKGLIHFADTTKKGNN